MSEILMVNFGDKTKKATGGYLHLRSGHLTVHKRLRFIPPNSSVDELLLSANRWLNFSSLAELKTFWQKT